MLVHDVPPAAGVQAVIWAYLPPPWIGGANSAAWYGMILAQTLKMSDALSRFVGGTLADTVGISSALLPQWVYNVVSQNGLALFDTLDWLEARLSAAGPWLCGARLTEAHRDVQHGLAITLEHFATRAQQQHALAILRFKLEVLWSMCDAMWMAYVAELPPFTGCEPPAQMLWSRSSTFHRLGTYLRVMEVFSPLINSRRVQKSD